MQNISRVVLASLLVLVTGACEHVATGARPVHGSTQLTVQAASAVELADAIDVRRYLATNAQGVAIRCEDSEGSAPYRHIGATLFDGSWFEVWVHLNKISRATRAIEVRRGLIGGGELHASLIIREGAIWLTRGDSISRGPAVGPIKDRLLLVAPLARALTCT